VDASGRLTYNGQSPAIFGYLVGPDEGFVVRGDLGVGAGYFEPQSATTFTASSFKGNYSEGSLWYGYVEQKASSGEVNSTGSGAITGNIDVAPILTGSVYAVPRPVRSESAHLPHANSAAVSQTYTSSANGRFQIYSGPNVVQILYVVSPSKAYSIDVSGAIWQPLEEFDHQ